MLSRLELVALIALGCAGANAPPAPTHPALTFDHSCAAEAGFVRTRADCVNCLATVQLPTCTCRSSDPYTGKCVNESIARSNTADCDNALDLCVSKCASDCACQKSCYSGNATCLSATEKRDSCVVDVCGAVCR